MPQPDSLAERLAPVARLRREQAPVRAFVALVSAIGIAAYLNHVVLWVWEVAYVVAQGFEVWALAPFAKPRAGRPPSPVRAAAALASIFVLALAFGSLSLLLLHAPGSLGAAAAVLLLCSGVLNVSATSRGSGEAFVAGAAPYALLVAWIALRLVPSAIGRDPLAPVLVLAAFTFILTAWMVWRDGERTWSRERAALREVERRRREAVEAWEARQAFVATASHELRTPLGAILAASGLLETGAPSPETRATASLIADASRMMRRLLDDLLDLARLEAGRMEVERAPFDAAALARETAALWTPPARSKALALTLEGVETLPTLALGDALRIRQVLNNLLSNAIKFTGSGEVRLRCRASEEPQGWALEFDVCDTGPGVSDEALARLFTPFTQAGPQIARLHGGSGLGLAISRELARLMAGSLVARRGAGGKGSVFTFALCVGAAARPEAAPKTAQEPPATGTQALRLLIVDDHPLSRQVLRLMLEAAGAEVGEAVDGEAALERLASEPFDAVMMDVTMPGLDGRETVRRLRCGGGPNADTPVLGVTGHGGEQAARDCRASGMDGCIVKPFEASALFDALAAVLSGPPARPLAA